MHGLRAKNLALLAPPRVFVEEKGLLGVRMRGETRYPRWWIQRLGGKVWLARGVGFLASGCGSGRIDGCGMCWGIGCVFRIEGLDD